MDKLQELELKLVSVWALLDERGRRLMAANEAQFLGYGGVSLVSRACGLSRKAIAKGIGEIRAGIALPAGRVRRSGAGLKKILEHDPGLSGALDCLIDPETRGGPQSPLL